MNCEQARAWLLKSDGDAAPAAVHVAQCENCRELQKQIVQLDSRIAMHPRVAESAAAKQRFLRKVDQLPVPREVAAHYPESLGFRKTVRRLVTFPGTILAVIVAAFFAGWMTSPRAGNNPPLQQDIAGHPRNDGSPDTARERKAGPGPRETRRLRPRPGSSAFLSAVIDNHVRLATAETPLQRFNLVGDLSGLVWQEVVRQVNSAPTADLPLLGRLYDLVVTNGLRRTSRALPADNQPAKRKTADLLQSRQTAARRLARDGIPAVNEMLLKIADDSQRSAAFLTNRPGLDPAGPHQKLDLAPGNILPAVVYHSLLLAEEDDPLRRADYCSAVAEQLSRTAVFTSLDGDADESEQLGTYLGEVVDRGVNVNLARFKPRGADDPRKKEYERIQIRSQRATDVLTRNLERAPPAARKGLLRALQARNHKHHRKTPRGKGPPSGKSRGAGREKSGDFVPPGLRKNGKRKRNGGRAPAPKEETTAGV